ncbi:VacB/RNase II family 3'-5' exoribonuclease [Euhalothece natronophila Z-M001]|uniref:VacB/RNase II family 3'-5' exoribonuclease n=1 Tax=Euhalothece natronophila Z-M001 TaxID=522448 RepID=A0A5B8NMI8_9CHRO|nr:ribonuclease R family protein [Euhalothece natronophila]QDZ40523.1 VacB/RNase II family 3'-5' exoribonuclease [Euhalothece natronophila Z-M001]
MEKGKLIEFKVQGERRLGVPERPEGKKNWIVRDQWGHSHTLHPRQVEYEVGGDPKRPQDIPLFLQEVDPYLDPSSLEVAWELLEGEPVTPEDMAEVLFSEQSAVACYAAYSLLAEDKIYFKQKGNQFEPRSPSQVAEIKHQQEVEKQRNQEKAAFIDRIKRRLAGEAIEWENSDRARFEALERYVLNPEQEVRLAQDTLGEVGREKTPEAAFSLLVDLGLWSRHENLFLRRSSYPVQFPQKVLDVAQQYLDSPPDDLERDRLDLTHQKVYTIDDESTKEIDDGLSIETLPDGREQIWIHIADPTRLVQPEDELDQEARRRCTSLYLPTGMIPMFPAELATGPMSLRQGQVSPAVSFGVILEDDGSITDYTIAASWVKPTYRLTYEDVDEMLELGVTAEPEIAQLAHWAEKRKEWRKSQGSINISLPEAMVKVDENEEVEIELLEDSPSHQLVAEMMILTGEAAGRFAVDNEIPLVFRSQPQPEFPPEEELLQLPAGPVRCCALRSCMPRSEMSTTPSSHAGLGLDVYAQVTSPIRRYVDLLAHFQLKAFLRGDSCPFSAEEMQEMAYSAASGAYEATLVERQTRRYWALEYLRRNSDQRWNALVLRWLREEDNLGIVLLEDLGLELPHRFQNQVELGDRLEMEVVVADPHQDLLRFREFTEELNHAL